MKTINEIKDYLTELFNDKKGLNLRLFLGTGDSEKRKYYLADISDEAAQGICKYYIDSVNNFFSKEDLSTIQLTDLDHRSDVLINYDIEKQPPEFNNILTTSNEKEHNIFSFNDNNLSEIKSIFIEISSTTKKAIFFKIFYPVALVKRDQILLYKKESRLEILNEDIIKITSGFELLTIENEFYINNFSNFEKNFSFKDIAEKIKSEVVSKIKNLNIAEDRKSYLTTLNIARKEVIRANSSPVLAMNSEEIIRFAIERQNKIGLKVENGLLILNSKESIKKLFRLINDDYLKSELTQIDYETLAKNELKAI